MRAVLLRPPQKPTPKKRFNSPPSRRPAHAVGRLPVYLRVAGTPAPSRARCGLHRDGAWGLLTINATSEFERHRSLSRAILAMQDL
jgi:hypothetical protein